MPRRSRILAGKNKGKFVLVRLPGERIYCEECKQRLASAKYPGSRWLCRSCGFTSKEGKEALERIKKRIRGVRR